MLGGGSLSADRDLDRVNGEARTATGGQKVTIKKGDLIVVPSGNCSPADGGTGKGFSMILIKVFARPSNQ